MSPDRTIFVFLLLCVFHSAVIAISGTSCESTQCIQKCCEKNEAIFNTTEQPECRPFDDQTMMMMMMHHPFLVNRTANYHVIYGRKCNEKKQLMFNYLAGDKVEFSADRTSLKVSELASVLPEFSSENFCFDFFDGKAGFFVCVDFSFVDDKPPQLTITGMILSMPFLLATFLVYAILPDRNLHQNALMFYVLMLLMSYILLVTINLSTNIEPPWCGIMGYLTLFFFMVSFFWMNVICFDIWFTFSGSRGFLGKRTLERKRLLLYGLYAFGGPALLVVTTFLVQLYLPPESNNNPNIGVTKCFLSDGWPSLWYFYLEAGIVVLLNVIFFLCTALRIRQLKKETSMLKHSDSQKHNYEKDKRKFNLYLKLLLAMGVNWSMEVISWAVKFGVPSYDSSNLFYATDFVNAVYGVFIFFMFVFKKKIWKLLQRRYYTFIGKPHLAQMMTSSKTQTSHFSSTAETPMPANNSQTRPEEIALRSA